MRLETRASAGVAFVPIRLGRQTSAADTPARTVLAHRGFSGSCFQIRTRREDWELGGFMSASPQPLNTARGWGRLSGKPSRLRVHRRHGWPRSALYALHVYRSLHLRLSTVTVRSLRATAIKTRQENPVHS